MILIYEIIALVIINSFNDTFFFLKDLIGGSYIVAISTLNGITPVILELASEIVSPISEGTIFFLIWCF